MTYQKATTYSEKDNGSFFNNHRIRVSKKKDLDECLFATNNDGAKKADLNLRVSGSAALDLAYVASGRLDGFFQNHLNLWDVAAGKLIVEEAGGKININNNYNVENINIKASSVNIYDKMLEKLINF